VTINSEGSGTLGLAHDTRSDVRTAPAERRLDELLGFYGGPIVSLASVLCDNHPDSDVAITVVGADLDVSTVTFGELRERSERLAASLASMGVERGTRVATLMGKSADLVTTLMAIWRCGGIHVPLFTAFAPPAIELRLTSSAAKVVVVDAAQREKLDGIGVAGRIVTVGRANGGEATLDELIASPVGDPPRVAVAGDDAFILNYTSGTTGLPKGVATAVRAIAGMRLYLEYGLGVASDDVYWNAADPGWAYGLFYAVVAPLAAGRTTTLLAAPFSPALAWQVLDGLGVSNFAAAPGVYRALRTAPPTQVPTSERRLSSAGEPLDANTIAWAREVLGVEIRDHYGQTELGMVIANGWHPDIRQPIKPASMGTPLPGWTVHVLGEDGAFAPPGQLGQVAIDTTASPAMPFAGYLDAPDRTAERMSADGRWYLTGDTAARDADGYFFFSSRDDDVIIAGGYRIGPFEIESVLTEHPDVVEAAVVGLPDIQRGQVIAAFVALRPGVVGNNDLTLDLQKLVKKRYAAHAYPRIVRFVDALPRTPSGKVQRYLLRADQ
jgi:acetyl-CoA synthetase